MLNQLRGGPVRGNPEKSELSLSRDIVVGSKIPKGKKLPE